MKITLGLILCYVGWSVILAQEYLPRLFSPTDVNLILLNPRLRNQYTACLLYEGPCTGDGLTLRNLLPEVIRTECEKCTVDQMISMKKVIDFLKMRSPQVWAKFVHKYDPTGQYLDKFERHLINEINQFE